MLRNTMLSVVYKKIPVGQSAKRGFMLINQKLKYGADTFGHKSPY